METTCAAEKEFGKELGMVHEGIITLRNLGLTAKGWQKMAEDKDLAGRVVALIEGEKETWLLKILSAEHARHSAFFDKEFDFTDFEATLKKYGKKKIRFWAKLGLEPHFLPRMPMDKNLNFPGWRVKPKDWFYTQVASGNIFRNQNGSLVADRVVELEGITVLIDTRLKPAYDNGKQMWKDDSLLGGIIANLRKQGKIESYNDGPQSSRFGVSADEWENTIKPVYAAKLNLNTNQLRLERAIEANVIPQIYTHMPRKDDGKTNTGVWYEEYFGDRDGRLDGGDFAHGGLADVSHGRSGVQWRYESFRPLAVL